MDRNVIGWALGGVAVVIAIIALVVALGVSGGASDTASNANMSDDVLDISRPIDRIIALEDDIRRLLIAIDEAKSEAAADTANLQAVLEAALANAKDDDDDNDNDEDISADLSELQSAIDDVRKMASENEDAIKQGTAGATALISAHAADHASLEGNVKAAVDAHIMAHPDFEGALEETAAELKAAVSAEVDELSADLSAKLEQVQNAVAPAATQAYVAEAIRRYKNNGRQQTLDYYGTMDSVNGDLYLFVLDQDYKAIVHPTVPENIGMDIRGPLGTDITGHNFGAEFVTATEEGKWIDYVYVNPANDFNYERKHTWVVRHENLLFGSGWYERDVSVDSINPAIFTLSFVQEAIDRYESEGHDATIAYYNSQDSVDGQWYVFIGDENDVMIAHPTIPDNVGKRYDEIVGPDGYPAGAQVAAAATAEGAWVDYIYLNPSTGSIESKHTWSVRHNGMIFGSGWYEEGPSKDDPATYTQAFVQRALNLYDAVGKEDTLTYYNSQGSIDGQWYLFMADADEKIIAHAPMPSLLNIDANTIVGSNGYELGKELLKATEEGLWVSYPWPNPASGEEETKRSWSIRHDGLFFGSGYYE